MELLLIKSLHIIFIVTWFAGLFYMVRLFVYHAEAEENNEAGKDILIHQFKLMEKRLWYAISWPSAVITLILGVAMLILVPGYLKQGWMHIKLLFVVALYVYHHIVHFQFKKFRDNRNVRSSQFYRYWNEVATVILVAIVFLVIYKTSILDATFAFIGFIGFVVLLFVAVSAYKKIRGKKNEK